MTLFGNKKSEPIAQNTKYVKIANNHKSKKKKNTYQVQFSTLAPAYLFELCHDTPLSVVVLNGKQIQPKTGWMKCTLFPNPCAHNMAEQHPILREIMGDKISTQIIEYLDKYTGKPVIQLYPDMVYVFDGYEDNYMSHLNHASRRDLARQITLRERLMNEFNQKQQNQK